MFDLKGKRVFVAGHKGMVGSALVRRLAGEDCEILTAPRDALDLTEQAATRAWFERERPDAVILAAARVGGILANRERPGEFAYDNLMIVANVIDAAHRCGAGKLLFLSSSAAYPAAAPQPIPEEALLTGPLDPAHQPYAVAKIAGMILAGAYRRQHGCDFISAALTNLYGPGDDFDAEAGHVVPALIRRAHEARLGGTAELAIWGSGRARREFLHVDDCADACVHLLRHHSGESHVNVGSGEDVSILELAGLVCEAVGYKGRIVTDPDKPDGVARKLMRADRLRALGWTPRIGLKEGLAATYAWFLARWTGHGR